MGRQCNIVACELQIMSFNASKWEYWIILDN